MSTKRRAAKDMTKFNMRIDRKLKEAAEKLAEDDQRSLASLIIKLLTDAVKKHGLLPKKPERRS
jgi:predicted HicB family RNase H-like nuclease